MSRKHEPGMAYDTKKLNKLFAVLSILFLAVVFWVFLDDYIRPWKAIQLKAMEIKRDKVSKELAQASAGIDQAKLKDLEASFDKAEGTVSSRKLEIRRVEKELMELDKKIKAETILNGTLNSKVSALTFNYETAHAAHSSEANDLFSQMRSMKKKFATSNDRLKGLTSQRKATVIELDQLNTEVTEAQKALTDLTTKRDLLTKSKEQLAQNEIFFMRNAPFLDYLDPTLKIQQVVLDNITDDRYFQQVPKVDRCMTCHTFIEKPGFEDQPNPFKTHPKLELMVGSDSPHPMKSYGCTTCHGGEGHRVNDFSSAAHTPEDEEQKAEWVKKYSWHAPHKVPFEMFKLSNTEAGCVKCHKQEEFIPGATVLNEGRMNMEKFGCYACHKIEGWEHKRNPGPSLERIAAKVDKKFFKNWVWDPKSFNKHAKMPTFFAQVNNDRPEFMRKNIAEINSMAEFIFNKSKSYKPFEKFSGGDKGKGKELIAEVGCMACHGVEGLEEASQKVDAYAGPYLEGSGSKLSGDWLVSWLLKPSHYQPNTIMPSFRLSKGEASDIAAYLLSLRNKKFERLEFESLDKNIRDELLIEYFSAFDTLDVARKKLESMSDTERTLDLGERSVGKYGCYSCHTIDGFEERAPIGPELTKVGSKPLTQFGFGHQKIEHSRTAWFEAHLKNPRQWDIGVDKPFKDLLRMPNFYMSDREAETITLALLGQVGDYIPMAGQRRFSADQDIANEGMKLVNKFNCVGCHQIDGARGDILRMYDDPNEGPPRLVEEGHRVQTDWFYHFLDNVYPIRPWLKVRMPSFKLTNKERNTIVRGFQAKASQPMFADINGNVSWLPGEREAAGKLFKSLDCASCHTTGFNTAIEATAPNLYYVRERLRPSWVHKWLKNPQAILPGTVMPNFWEDGVSMDEEILGGDPEKQINALTKYLYEIGMGKTPFPGEK